MSRPEKAYINPLPTHQPILPQEDVVNSPSLPCGFVNSTCDIDIENNTTRLVRNTRCFAIETAHALFDSPKIASFLQKHSAAHKRHTEANGTELSNCYACDLADARNLVYVTGAGALAPDRNSFWPSGAWDCLYTNSGDTMSEKFPAVRQQSAQEYLDYVSCLFSEAE